MAALPSSREERLLVLAARPERADDAVRELIEAGVDWGLIAALAKREKVSNVLWRRLSASRHPALGTPAAGALATQAHAQDALMFALQRRLRTAVAALGARGIEVMLLKGAALATTVYRSFGARPMGDVDMLVRPERLEEAHAELLRGGWTPLELPPSGGFFERHHHLPPLRDAGGKGVLLELHSALLPTGHPFSFPVDEVWRDARRAAVGAAWAVVPSPTHQLLHLCLHVAWSHSMESGVLRAARDVETLARQDPPDWWEFVRRARLAGAATCCYWTLRLARVVAGAAVPEGVLRELRPGLPEWALSRVERHFLATMLRGEVVCPSVRVRKALWTLAIQPGESGHGRVRPWHHGETFARPPEPVTDAPASSVQPWLRRWRYVRTILIAARA